MDRFVRGEPHGSPRFLTVALPGFADTLFMGRISAEAFAAVGLGGFRLVFCVRANGFWP